MRDPAFLRSDELSGRAALGYLSDDGLRSNVTHLPVRGSGDGGIYATAADVSALWKAFLHDPARGLTTRSSPNTSEGAWPVARLLEERLEG